MKKSKILLAILLTMVFALCAMGSGDDSSGSGDQGSGNADANVADNTQIGAYSVEILSSRLSKDFEGKDVIVIKYKFTNNSNDTATSFWVAFDDGAYQGGVGLNNAYVLQDGDSYSEDNQNKEIKKGASIEVEVAYELNDTTTDVEVEVKELFSFDDKTITKTFKIAE